MIRLLAGHRSTGIVPSSETILLVLEAASQVWTGSEHWPIHLVVRVGEKTGGSAANLTRRKMRIKAATTAMSPPRPYVLQTLP